MEPSANPNATNFVTALGWVLIIFTGFGVVTSVMQNVMVSFVVPALDQRTPEAQQMPRGTLVAFRMLAAFMLCAAVFLLFSAWSFLKRRNWARKTFVVIFALGAVWGGLVFLAFGLGMGVFNILPQLPSSEAPPGLGSAFRIMGIMIGLVAAGFAALFIWLIKCLRSPGIRGEFQA